MSIPHFRDDGWLPNGHHPSSIDEVIDKFGPNLSSFRDRVATLLLDWYNRVYQKGIRGRLILDGSFISSKPDPSDFDAFFIYDDFVHNLMENDEEAKTLLDYQECKNLGFDLFIMSKSLSESNSTLVHLDVFDFDTRSNIQKGVVEINI